MSLGTILLIIVVLMLLGVLPYWGHSRNWGYGPSGGVGLLVIILVVTGLMCLVGYWVGWQLPRWLGGGGRADQVSMSFAMGMSNNGTGLVLASTFLPHHALVLLPLILFNLLQQIVAGWLSGRADRRHPGA